MQKLLDPDTGAGAVSKTCKPQAIALAIALIRSMEARRQKTEAILNARAPLGASPRSLAAGC